MRSRRAATWKLPTSPREVAVAVAAAALEKERETRGTTTGDKAKGGRNLSRWDISTPSPDVALILLGRKELWGAVPNSELAAALFPLCTARSPRRGGSRWGGLANRAAQRFSQPLATRNQPLPVLRVVSGDKVGVLGKKARKIGRRQFSLPWPRWGAENPLCAPFRVGCVFIVMFTLPSPHVLMALISRSSCLLSLRSGDSCSRRALSLMGNQLDRITHLSYSELPTGDPSGIEKDELRVGVAYFFSDEEEDLDERGQPDKYCVKGSSSPAQESPTRHHHHHHHAPQLVLSETQFSAFRGQECIFSKVSGDSQTGDLSVYPASALPALCKPGDLLELLYLGPSDHSPPPPQWAVYVGNAQIIHLHQGQIRQDSLYEAAAGNVGRVVSSWYRFRPLVAELVVQNACSHLGLKSHEICWTNSESFAAWCRFGKREFKAGGELQPASGSQPQQQYYLKIHLADNKGHTVRFQSLEDLIREKRRIDASGKLRVIQELAIVDGKE